MWNIQERIAKASAISAPIAAGASMATTAADITSAGANSSRKTAASSGGAGLVPASATNRFQCAAMTNSIATQIATLAANGTRRNRNSRRTTIIFLGA